MNLASAILKVIIDTSDLEVWGKLRVRYLPDYYRDVYQVISAYYDKFLRLPTFTELKLGVRASATLEKLSGIELLEVDAEADALLEYLKNEYVQKEILERLDHFLEKTVITATAEETLESLASIPMEVSDLVDLEDGDEPLHTMDILSSPEDVLKFLSLGFNNDFDAETQFGRTDLVMLGGRRGQGKSLTAANIVANQFNNGKTAQYFTIEMRKRPILQRVAAISTGISAKKIGKRDLSQEEYFQLAKWQATRFEGGEEVFTEYLKHSDYSKFQDEVTRLPLKPDNQLDIVYDNRLSVSKVRAEVERLKTRMGDQFTVVAVDYINKMVRSNATDDMFDWKEQVKISNELKQIADDYDVLMFVPYQIDASGEARFAKGILDAADASFVINSHAKSDECITFKSTKMRSDDDEVTFTSKMDWSCLKIGPQSVLSPDERASVVEDDEDEKREPHYDI